jgi:hypothetical protein
MTAPAADIARLAAPERQEPLTADIACEPTGIAVRESEAALVAAGDPTEIAVLRETVARLTALNQQQAAQLAELAGPAEWLALRACDAGGYSSEAVRGWCETGKVMSRRDGSRVFVNTRSLAAHLKKLGLARAIKIRHLAQADAPRNRSASEASPGRRIRRCTRTR